MNISVVIILASLILVFGTVVVEAPPGGGGGGPPPKGEIIIEKQTVNEQPPKTDFEFSSTFGSFELKDNMKEKFDKLTSGTYNFSEVVPAGWILSMISCSIDGSSSYVANGSMLTIELEEDDKVHCIYVDIKLSDLTAGGCREIYIIKPDFANGTNVDYRRCTIIDSKVPVLGRILKTSSRVCVEVTDDVGIEQVRINNQDVERWSGFTHFYCIKDAPRMMIVKVIDIAGNIVSFSLYSDSDDDSGYSQRPDIEAFKHMLNDKMNLLSLNLIQKVALQSAIEKYPYDLSIVEMRLIIYITNSRDEEED